MLKKFLAAGFVSLFLTGTLCAGNIDFDQSINLKDLVKTLKIKADQSPNVPPSAAPAAGQAEWTIMVYINAKNNLERFGLLDVNEMEMVGSTDKVKIVAELGRIANYDDTDGNWTGSRRYIVQKDDDFKAITSPVLQEIKQSDMGDWKHLVNFTQWAKQQAPAKRYMLIVWNHGSGWVKSSKDFWIRGISYDDETNNHITTLQLQEALKATGKMDIYASDACLMQMAEVGYQIKDYADYIVASEETEPGDGYTYDLLLAPLVKNPAMTGEQLAKLTVQAYTDHYLSVSQNSTQSAIRTAALPRLYSLLNEWSQLVMTGRFSKAVKKARSQALSFAYSDNKDLAHFVALVQQHIGSGWFGRGWLGNRPSIKAKTEELLSFLNKDVILYNGISGEDMANAKGLAIYIPDNSYNTSYNELTWAKGNWPAFIKWAQKAKR